MDNSDIILEKLNSMEKAIRTEMKLLNDKQDGLAKKQDELAEKQEMTWQAIKEMRDELTNNSLKIKIIDNKVKAL
ncbi:MULTISPECIES: hypothetical protein [unclassified Dehalobacter]|uniref:hypothetical protein n=1 Tax=unclassified Dehalobacter TaxID=2635733 RepID=UPI000371DA19|nr:MULTISPECIES: hypothetical protein [unclassified Dehalobacter]RJE47174.1 hypothetical protein A7K50_04160 [Dehalobacter sp. MCB1]TCX53663.1 hypothetical protein C1I36_02680 [Dehalobacter sp. 14DCB1]TCX54966.1 hypothetical protein C1I38_04645 [Dehalobacter sp. 12DCB1]